MSVFHLCQSPNCKAEAEYRCSCSLFLCNHHNRRHDSSHQSTVILVPLEDQELALLDNLSVSNLARAQMKTEIARKNEEVKILLEKIKKIERESSARMTQILKKSDDLLKILLKIKKKKTVPLFSKHIVVDKIINLLKTSNLNISELEEIFTEQLQTENYEDLSTHIYPETEYKSTNEHFDEEITASINHEKDQLSTESSSQEMSDTSFYDSELLMEFKAHSHAIYTISVSNCEDFIATGSQDNRVKIWDPDTGDLLASLENHSQTVTSVDFNALSDRLVSGSFDKTAIVWNLNNFKPTLAYAGHSGGVLSVCFSIDSKCVASGSSDKSIHIWRAEDGTNISVLNGHSNWVTKVLFVRDGRRLISGSDDGKAIVWEFRTGNILNTFNGHTGCIFSLSVYNNFVASGGKDKRILLWDIDTGDTVKTLQGHSDFIRSVDFSSSGQFIASASFDSCINIWSKGKLVNSLPDIGYPCVRFSGNKIVAGDGQGIFRIWNIVNLSSP